MLNLSNQYDFLEYLHPITWGDIFAVWRANEAYQKMWQEHWVERGFDSWDFWRKNYIAPIKPEQKEWHVYRIKNPLENVKLFYGAPTRGWIKKCYGGELTKQISKILDHPIVFKNDKVLATMNNFPYQTMVTGFVSDGKIVLVEGFHRILALALMEKNGVNYNGDIVIALCEQSEILPLGKGDEENKKAIIKVFGKVQGVYFRKFTQEKMRELGLMGFVKNNEDGTVSIEASGPEYVLREMIYWCHDGSPEAVIEKVKFEIVSNVK